MSESVGATRNCTLDIESHGLAFRKFILHKNYRISRIGEHGQEELLSIKQSRALLNSGTFKGSLAMTRDSRHAGVAHKIVYLFQWINHQFFHRRGRFDLTLCHSFIITGRGIPTSDSSKHPFFIAHSDAPGQVQDSWDPIADNAVSDVVIYQPVDKSFRYLYRRHANQTTFPLQATRTPSFSSRIRARYGWLSGATALFARTIYSPNGTNQRQHINEQQARRTAYVVADLLLQDSIKDQYNRPESFICSAYAATILQGSVLIHALQGLHSSEILTFIQEKAGRDLSRHRLADAIYRSITGEDQASSIARRLRKTYQDYTIARYNTPRIMSMHIAEQLDRMLSPHPPLSTSKDTTMDRPTYR